MRTRLRNTLKGKRFQGLLIRAMKEGLSELRRVNDPTPSTKARLGQLERDLLKLKRERQHE